MAAWLGIPLVIISAYCVYSPPFGLQNGVVVLWVTVPLGLYLVYLVTRPAPERLAPVIESFRRFDIAGEAGAGDTAAKPGPADRSVLVNTVTAVPSELGFLLERAGGGAPLALLELHRGIAYLAINEADELAVSDHTTVLMKLEAPAPTFTVRPFVATDQAPVQLVTFKKDPEFAKIFVVEGADAKAVRAFLDSSMRDALLEMPEVWVTCEGKVLAFTRYGVFDPAETRRLIDAADLFFAEYGAGGGPSLLEPQGQPVKKKKAKQKTKAAASRAAT